MNWKHRMSQWLFRNYPFVRGKTRIDGFANRSISGYELSKDVFGNTFLLNLDSLLDAIVFLHGGYETNQIRKLSQWAEEHSARYFFDIGANIGLYSVQLSSLPTIQNVHSFEPDPRNYQHLQANLLLNNRTYHVTSHNCALSDENGEVDMYLAVDRLSSAGDKHNRGLSSLVKTDELDSTKTFKVATARLDDMFSIDSESVIVKIDVEGHEFSVLNGMRNLLKKNHCYIQVEIWPEAFLRDRVRKFFQELGYQELEQLPQHKNDYFFSN